MTIAAEPRRIDGLVACAAVGALIASLAAVDLGGYLVRRSARAADAPVSLAIAGRAVTVPEAWIARTPEPGTRLDLAIPFPSAPERAEERLHVTATPAEPGQPAGLGAHHARFLSAVARSYPGGLVQRRYRDGTPYEGEELYVTPPDGAVFAARCATAAAEGAAGCLAEVRLDGLDLRVRFPQARLEEWEAILATLRRTLGAP
jgi:hypothetical protein